MVLELERRVLDMLLAGDLPVLQRLRHQLTLAKVKSRQFTGKGFFTNFESAVDSSSAVTPANFELADIAGKVSGTPCGFILFIRGGFVSFLEGFTYGEDPWPENSGPIELHYLRHPSAGSSSLVPADVRDLHAIAQRVQS